MHVWAGLLGARREPQAGPHRTAITWRPPRQHMDARSRSPQARPGCVSYRSHGRVQCCAITGEHSLPALDAAHIRPFALEGPHETRNGLLLRSDLHKLFDHGYRRAEDFRVEVSNRLREEYQNGIHNPLHGGTAAAAERARRSA